ncbi:MAG TPA: glycosyl hydrolase 115 family protein, partial [Verrucomicrobiae bacterium]|nr:glycosyl hydrolase 115 family protein [Verrucomicrobiae bacterium]
PISAIYVATNEDQSVRRAVGDLAEDFVRVTGIKPKLENTFPSSAKIGVIVGTIGKSEIVDRFAAEGKLATNGVAGQWESYVLQIVNHPRPGVARALVIAGSDRRGTIYGIYTLSKLIGVSPWYWWADAPVKHKGVLALRGDMLKQGPPAVKYRGIFLNDEDWGLRPWAAKTFDPATGNIGPKTYAKVFELLLRLRANYLWPAMHPGTRAFNSFPEDPKLANEYGVVMGSSHCEQMLRNNVSEWNEKKFGAYNYVTNPKGVLKYWEDRVKANGKYENIYTVGMRGIHDSGMPGGGTGQQKADRLSDIIQNQRQMLARWVNPDVTKVPQIFCPYKEVLGLYHLMPGLPDDITLVWPDDNYGYIREFSNARERARSGAAGVYYHVSYYGRPHDYLWLCSTPPALIAEEMSKAFDYGASRVWVLNVGDLKPAELDIEYFLNLAWHPHEWHGTNTYDLLQKQFARDFGPATAPELTSIMAEYYRLNFQRKPEHVGFPQNPFSPAESVQRLAAWKKLVARVDAVGKKLPPDLHDAFFELVAYPVRVAALANERVLSPANAAKATGEIDRLTAIYNNQIAGGKWRYIMSDNPRGQVVPKITSAESPERESATRSNPEASGGPQLAVPRSKFENATNFPGADFVEENHHVIMEAEDASAFVPGAGAHWGKIIGLGYNGEAVSVFPPTVPVCDSVKKILADSPCLQYKLWLKDTGNWRVTVRALPTFSVEAGKPQR